MVWQLDHARITAAVKIAARDIRLTIQDQTCYEKRKRVNLQSTSRAGTGLPTLPSFT
jgi:hypothetical protein